MTQKISPDISGGSIPDRNVIPKLWEYMNYVHLKFPLINGLEKARPVDTAWEMVGRHTSGMVITVRCHLEHGIKMQGAVGPCSMSFDTKTETLNTYIEKHLNETNRACVHGFKFIVLSRDSVDSIGGIRLCDHSLTKLTNTEDDMARVCSAIGFTDTLKDNDDDLDVHDNIHHHYSVQAPSSLLDKDGDMDMDDSGNGDDEFDEEGWLREVDHHNESEHEHGDEEDDMDVF